MTEVPLGEVCAQCGMSLPSTSALYDHVHGIRRQKCQGKPMGGSGGVQVVMGGAHNQVVTTHNPTREYLE